MEAIPERDDMKVVCGRCGKAPERITGKCVCQSCGAVAQWIGDPDTWHRPMVDSDTKENK